MSDSDNKTRAGASLVLGVFVFLGSIYLAFGISAVAVVSAITALGAVMKALQISSPEAGKSIQDIFGELLRRGPFRATITWGCWFSAICLFAFWGVRAYRTPKLVSVQGLVVTAMGNPVDSAVVSMNFGGRQFSTATAAGGHFSFEPVDRKQVADQRIEITATYRGNGARVIQNLSNWDGTPFTLRLPVFEREPRILYYDIGGHSLDFLLRGKVDSRWEETLSGQPYIVPNETFRYLKSLAGQFTVPFGDSYLYLGSGGAAWDEKNHYYDIARETDGKPLFVGGWNGHLYLLSRNSTIGDFNEINSGNSAWNLKMTDAPFVPEKPVKVGPRSLTINPNAFFFWRFTRAEDFDEFLSIAQTRPFAEFYKFITKAYLPDDLAILRLAFSDCGEYTGVITLTRYVRLRFAVIENVNPDPIRIGNMFVATNPIEQIRETADDASTLKNLNAHQEVVFPQELLAPREKVLIPLQLYLSYDEDALQYFFKQLRASDEQPRNRAAAALSQADSITLTVGGPEQYNFTAIDPTVFGQLLNKAPALPDLGKEYVFGPSSEIRFVEIDGTKVPFRERNPKIFTLRSGSETGSCPYLYTHSSEGGWMKEGHILEGANSVEKERTDRRFLQQFDGHLLIREEDAETSFIRGIYIVNRCRDGREEVLLPTDRSLFNGSRPYLVLHHGEEKEIYFSVPLRQCRGDYEVSATGYYLPN